MAHCDHQSSTGDITKDLRLTSMIYRLGEYQMMSKFRPHLLEYKEIGDVLSVVFRPTGPIRIFSVAPVADLFFGIRRRDGKQKGITGLKLWGVSVVLQGYKKPSISFEHIIKRFDRYHKLSTGASVFGEYKEQILAIAREHQFVWWIPK